MKTTKLDVEGMHCGACVSRVEEALRGVEGVDRVDVSLEDGAAVVYASGPADEPALVGAVEEAGYQASPEPSGA